MRDRLEIVIGVIFACSKQWQGEGEDWCDSLKQNGVGIFLWKHGLSQNARIEHEWPESIKNVIGSAVGVSVNTNGRPTKLNAVAAEFIPGSAHQQTNSSLCAEYISDMTGVRGGHSASQGAVGIGNGHVNEAPVGGGVLLIGSKQLMHRLQ